jgi:hypothetical protein
LIPASDDAEFGGLTAAWKGFNMSPNSDINMARMYEALGEYDPVYLFYRKAYETGTFSRAEKILLLNTLSYMAPSDENYWVAKKKYIQDLKELVEEKDGFENEEEELVYDEAITNGHNYDSSIETSKKYFLKSSDWMDQVGPFEHIYSVLIEMKDPIERSIKSEEAADMVMTKKYYTRSHKWLFQTMTKWIFDSAKRKKFIEYIKRSEIEDDIMEMDRYTAAFENAINPDGQSNQLSNAYVAWQNHIPDRKQKARKAQDLAESIMKKGFYHDGWSDVFRQLIRWMPDHDKKQIFKQYLSDHKER